MKFSKLSTVFRYLWFFRQVMYWGILSITISGLIANLEKDHLDLVKVYPRKGAGA